MRDNKLTTHTKMAVLSDCVPAILLYSSESWTLYSGQEKRLDAFHVCSLLSILGIGWSDCVPNTEVLPRAEIPSMFTLLMQHQLC